MHGYKKDHVGTNRHRVICGGKGWLMMNNIGTIEFPQRIKKIPKGSFLPSTLKYFHPCCHSFLEYFLESLYYTRNWISFPNFHEMLKITFESEFP